MFAVHALRVPRPLLDLRLYRRATFASASIAMFCLGAALFGGMILMPLYWQQVRFESVLDTGLLIAPMGLGMASIMPFAGRLTDRFGGGPLALIGVVVTTLATIPFAMIGAHTSIAGALAAIGVVRGMGVGFAFMPAMTAAFASLKHSELSDATPQLNVAPARRRLDRHRGARRRAPARAARARIRSSRRPSAYGTAFWWSVGDHRGRDRPLHRAHLRRARCAPRRRPRADPDVGAARRERRVSTAAPPADVRDEAIARSEPRSSARWSRCGGCAAARRTGPGAPSFAQYQLLFALADREDVSAGELATAADLSPATVTQMLDSLVELGFVTRDRSTLDRRVVTCSLTADGRELIAERRALFEGRWAAALADVETADLAVAADVFDRIAAMFDDFDAED